MLKQSNNWSVYGQIKVINHNLDNQINIVTHLSSVQLLIARTHLQSLSFLTKTTEHKREMWVVKATFLGACNKMMDENSKSSRKERDGSPIINPPTALWENKEVLTQQRPFQSPSLHLHTLTMRKTFFTVYYHPKTIYSALGAGAGKHPPASNTGFIL